MRSSVHLSAGVSDTEALPVADLRCADAPPRLRLAAAVDCPPGALVEPACARVVLEHPERHFLVLHSQLVLGARDQREAGAGRPLVGIDIDRVELANSSLVSARADRRETDHRPVVLRDERRPSGGRTLEALVPAARLDE